MKLEDIGFYTLTDERAANTCKDSRLSRCELILTDVCNFKCPYCRGIQDPFKGSLSYKKAEHVVGEWIKNNLKNVRFSGGEPTMWPGLLDLIKFTKAGNVERIAISTNGSANFKYYMKLIEAGVNDISISLDACCPSTGDMMAGNIPGIWNKVTNNIKALSKETYVTVGVVLTETNINEFINTVKFASENLEVSDIRIIPSAQWNAKLLDAVNIANDILDNNKLLKYRVCNIKNGRHVRGIQETDNHQCPLVLDDMAVLGMKHFPCIIYLREQGNPIGDFTNIETIREERFNWFKNHNVYEDKICKNNCLDVCIDYNNKVRELNKII